MKQLTFKRNRVQSTILKIQLYIFKLKVRSMGVSIWDKTLIELINQLHINVELQNKIINGNTTTIEILAIVFNQKKYSDKKNLKQQIHRGNQALIKASNHFSIPLKDKNVSLILLHVKQELLKN